MKKVLVLSSSPRKGGNSDKLCDAFLSGAEAAGHRVEKIRVAEKKIGYCLGCDYCQTRGTCCQKDDMVEILAKMVSADVLVFATPVYFYTVSAQLKTLIDRTVPRYTQMTNKEVYFLLTMADDDEAMFERTIEALRGFTESCLEGTVEKGILCAGGVWKVGEIDSTPYLTRAYEMGKNC